MSRRKSKTPPSSPSSAVCEAAVSSSPACAWRPLDVAQRPVGSGEVFRRILQAVAVMVALPLVCALLLVPFFYRNSSATAAALAAGAESQIFFLPEYEEVADDGDASTIYDWLRIEDPRQYLLPDTRAGFSRFLHFRPLYAAEAFPVYQAAKAPEPPQYAELFSRIAPQFPRTIVNEQIQDFWKQLPTEVMVAKKQLPTRAGAGRPVWRLADGTVVPVAEEPQVSDEVLEYWRSDESRARLAKTSLQKDGGRTMLEVQILPSVAMPQLVTATPLQDEPRLPVNRVVLRRSCGDARLDQAAVAALRRLLLRRSADVVAARPGRYSLQVDWGCW